MPVPDGLPMRLPPTAEQRQQTLLRTGAAAGRSKSLGPVPQRAVSPYQPVTGGTGGPVASATYLDNVGSALGGIGNPSTLYRSAGLADRYFAYNGSDGILLLQDGWYQVSSAALVNGATPGDALRAFCYFTTPQTVEGSDIATAGGTANPTAMSLPFYDDGTGTLIQVSVENHTSANGTVVSSAIHLVAFG